MSTPEEQPPVSEPVKLDLDSETIRFLQIILDATNASETGGNKKSLNRMGTDVINRPEDLARARVNLVKGLTQLIGYFDGERRRPPEGFQTQEEAASMVGSIVNGLQRQKLTGDPLAAVASRMLQYARKVYTAEGGIVHGFDSMAKTAIQDIEEKARDADIAFATGRGGRS